ncbi:hypothetical protein C8J57DRAFT_1564384 [Mycena rebaudengoi]|nr:hypothetical protein C8J57DRAFT_1564384 [Mycena rebaudengoi]
MTDPNLEFLLSDMTVTTNLDEYKCPVLTLPTEITSEIFVHFLPPYPERPPATGLSSLGFLGQISRTWRESAFSMPRLWRAIELHHGDVSSTTALDLLRTWMSRSKNCPLSICLECNKDVLKMEIDVTPFIEAIIAHAEHWEYIDLKAPLHLQGLELISSGPDFPLLRSVTLRHSRGKDMPEAPLSLFSNAPKLKEVALSGPLGLRFAIQLPWSQLTTISMKLFYEDGCVNILQHATALVEFRCDGVFRRDDEDPSPMAPLKNLQSLALGYRYRPLLDRLTTSALQHLSISDPRIWATSHTIAKAHALILRSRCALASLRFTHTIGPEATYRSAFPLIPTITATEHES